LRYRKPSIVIRNVKYERCLHFEWGNCTQHQSTLFLLFLFCFKMKNLVLPLKRLRFPVGNDIGHYYTLKRRAAVDCCCYFPYIPSRLSRWSFKLMESIKYQEARACFSVRLGFQPTPTHSPHLPVYTKAVSLSHLGNWWYPMCTLGGSRTARSVFFSWPIALWRPPYSFWLFFFYNRKIQWCPFVFVCQAVLSSICLALEELGSALLPRWNNNTTSSSTAAPPTLKGAVLFFFFFFLVSAVFWLHAAAFGSPRRKASFKYIDCKVTKEMSWKERQQKSCTYTLSFLSSSSCLYLWSRRTL
jgi:hypothetical protein